MAHSGEHTDIGQEDGDDFGGGEDTSIPAAADGRNSGSLKGASPVQPLVQNAAPTGRNGVVQSNQGPAPTEEYGASVPVEGKRNEGPTDFNHPASVEPQRIVWIPNDPLGLGEIESQALNARGVEASTEHATMNEGGHVDIDSHPPGSDPNTLFG